MKEKKPRHLVSLLIPFNTIFISFLKAALATMLAISSTMQGYIQGFLKKTTIKNLIRGKVFYRHKFKMMVFCNGKGEIFRSVSIFLLRVP